MAVKILCVEHDEAVLEGRSAVLKASGYDAASASPRLAEVGLPSQEFDLLVLSSLSDSEVNRLVSLADGATVLVVDDLTMPAELMTLVAQRLDSQQRA